MVMMSLMSVKQESNVTGPNLSPKFHEGSTC